MATATASKQAPAKRTKPKSSTSATYTYKGVDRKGNKVDGEVDGSSQALVRARLVRRERGVLREPRGAGALEQRAGARVRERRACELRGHGLPSRRRGDALGNGDRRRRELEEQERRGKTHGGM